MILSGLMPLIAGVALSVPLARAAQDSYELYRPLQDVAERFERESRVRDLYADADPEGREAALALFAADRSATRVFLLPDDSTLVAVSDVLEEPSGTVGPDFAAEFVSALTVRLTPGIFAVRESGPGEPITVHIELPKGAAVPAELVLGLEWIAPDGTRTRARTESFSSQEFGRGLDMYIRPPVSGPADWELAPVLILGERILHAPGVRVWCVADTEQVHARLQAGTVGSRAMPLRRLWMDWNYLRDFGVRPTSAASLPQRLGHFGLPGGQDWSHDYRWLSFGEEDRLGAWGFAPTDDAKGAVLIITDGRRDETAVFAGSLEPLWNRFARDRNLLVLALSDSGSEEDAAHLNELVMELRRQGVVDLSFVASGGAAIILPPRLRAMNDGTVSRFVLHSTPIVSRGVRLALEAPVLGISHAQEEGGETLSRLDGSQLERWWARRRAPGFLVELEVPVLLGRWMDGGL